MAVLDEYTPLAIVDVETTGADPAADRVTEIAVLEASGATLTGRWSTLVNPGLPVPGAIQALTGITQHMVDAAPRFAQIADELYRILSRHLGKRGVRVVELAA